jgi:hypothetical protein
VTLESMAEFEEKLEVVDLLRHSQYIAKIIPDECILEDFMRTLQSVHREFGWPDLNVHRKEECMDEVKRVLDEKFSGHHGFYFR